MRQPIIFLNYFFLLAIFGVAAITDPVADYLRPDFPYAFAADSTAHRGAIYSNETVFRFDVDLNRDGKKEILISSSRDRDGKQGNVFYLYREVEGGFEFVPPVEHKKGDLTFMTVLYLSPNGFYLDRIDEVDAYGIIKWRTAGGGEGAYVAYIFDGEKIIEKALGAISRNPKTTELEGKGIEIAAKYSPLVSDAIREQVEKLRLERGLKVPDPSSFVSKAQIITAKELEQKYSIRVEPKTYQEALQEGLLESQSKEAPPATPTPTQSTPTLKPSATSVASPIAEARQSSWPEPLKVDVT